VLERLVIDAYKSIVDVKLMKAAKKIEKADKKYLLNLVEPKAVPPAVLATPEGIPEC
jgi:hypothetical protein